MNWKIVIAAVAVLATERTSLAAEALTDGQRLLAFCEEAEKDAPQVPFRATYCMAFIEGALRGWEASAFARDVPVNYCITSGTTMLGIVRIVTKHLRENPAALRGRPELSVISAVHKAFPCSPPPKR